METLPLEVLIKIADYAPVEDNLLSLRSTSSRWRAASTEALSKIADVDLRISTFQKLSRRASIDRLFQNKDEWLLDLFRYLLSIFGHRLTKIRFDNLPNRDAFMLMSGVNSGETSPWTITPTILDVIFEHAPSISDFDFGLAEAKSDLYPILSRFDRLRSLAIHDVDETFRHVLDFLPRLRKLTVSGKDAPLVWRGSQNIRELCLRQPTPQSYLNLCGGENFDFNQFAAAFPNLRSHLDARTGLSIISPVMRHGLSPSYRRLTSLKRSTILNYFCTFRSWTPDDVRPFANLRSLIIKVTTMDAELLTPLRAIPRLADLRLWFRRSCSYGDLRSIFGVDSLRTLHIRDFEWERGDFQWTDSSDDQRTYFYFPIESVTCQRLETLRIWTSNVESLFLTQQIFSFVIEKSASNLKNLQLFLGRKSDDRLDEAIDFTRCVQTVLLGTGLIRRLKYLDTPFYEFKNGRRYNVSFRTWRLETIFFEGANRLETLALDIDRSSLEFLISRLENNRNWSDIFPRLNNLSFRFQEDPGVSATNVRFELFSTLVTSENVEKMPFPIDRFLIECPKLEQFFIDAPCLLSKSLIESIGTHSKIDRITIVNGKLDEKSEFGDLMRLLAVTRQLAKKKNGYRLPVMRLNLNGFSCSEDVTKLLYSVGVILNA